MVSIQFFNFDLSSGRFVVNNSTPLSKSPWQKSALCIDRRTEQVKMLKSSNMKAIEDLTENSLPSEPRFKDSLKYEQLGAPAVTALFKSALDVAASKLGVPALPIVDLHTKEGDGLQAFMDCRASLGSNLTLYYVGLCKDEKEKAWVTNEMIDHYAKELLAGRGPAYLQTDALKQQEMPADLKPSMPVPPQLGVAVLKNIGVEDSNHPVLHIPYSTVQKWQGVESVGNEWGEFLKSFNAKDHCTIGAPEEVSNGGNAAPNVQPGVDEPGANVGNANKRTANNEAEGLPNSKKRHVSSKYVLPQEKVPELSAKL